MHIKHCVVLALLLGSSGPTRATDWTLHGADYANTRFSPLHRVHTGNVKHLKLAWSLRTGKRGAFQATPIVHQGQMFVSTPFNDVLALDALTGQELWRYRHQLQSEQLCCGPANRGVALAQGRVFQATVDNRLIALAADSGVVLWDVPITNTDAGVREVLAPLIGDATFTGATVTGGTGYTANMAPQVFDGKVFIGISGTGYGLHVDRKEGGAAALSVIGLSGGQHGLRGFLAAYDAATGRELWRWYSVPPQGWEGDYRATTADGLELHRDLAAEKASSAAYAESWRLGGGSIWSTPAIDVPSRTLYVGTGNPAPQMDDLTRPGDNLHTCSLVALDLDTGRLRWAYQIVPHDRWGYDVASPPVLVNIQHAGAEREAVAIAAKTGWVYVLDRHSGELLYRSEPFVPQQNLFTPPSPAGVLIAPAILGGASWSPPALDEEGRLYIEGIHHPARYFQKPLKPSPGQAWSSYTYMELATEGRAGTLSAFDIHTGKRLWQQERPAPLIGGLLATAGGLLFAGEGDGGFHAFDAGNGKRLWSYRAAAGVNAPPISYSVGDEQFIAVAAGGNPLFNYRLGDELLVFSLPREEQDDRERPRR